MKAGAGTPARAATEQTFRQASSYSAMTFAKYGSSSRLASFASFSYASVIFWRNRARMMHPPRQMLAISPNFRSHS